MMRLIEAYEPFAGQILLAIIFALSQFVVLRAGVFSIATAGMASIGAYTAAILTTTYGVPSSISILAGLLAGTASGLILAIPLARLRGIYQAIATLAFVQIIISLALYFEDLTSGAKGLNEIPNTVDTWDIALATIVICWIIYASSQTLIGRALNAVREDETVAVSLGIEVKRYHRLVFALSGAIAGAGGALYAFHSYSLVPTQFGFSMMTQSLTAVVLGGRTSVFGPIVGAIFLVVLPEISRTFANQSYLVHGALLVLISIYLPDGLWDTGCRLIRRFALRAGPAPKVAA